MCHRFIQPKMSLSITARNFQRESFRKQISVYCLKTWCDLWDSMAGIQIIVNNVEWSKKWERLNPQNRTTKKPDQANGYGSGTRHFMGIQIFFYLIILDFDFDLIWFDLKSLFQTYALISNIGGSFGLFIGLSLVTIVEVVEFVYDLTILVVCRLFTRRSQKKQAAVAPE